MIKAGRMKNSKKRENIYTDGTYYALHKDWHTKDAVWKARQIQKILSRNQITPVTFCDVGCGSGEIISLLYRCLQPPAQCCGYEISPQAYALCRQKEQERLSFYLKDIFEAPDHCFDLAMAIDVIEHVEDFYGFLREFQKKGKYKILHIPLDLSVMSLLRPAYLKKKRREGGHIHYFTGETALAALHSMGYRVVDWFFTSAAVDLPPKSFKSALMRFPRKLLFKISPDQTARLLGGYSILVLAV